MSETASLHLPLLQPSQAQKHITVNEALVHLDGLVQLSAISRQLSAPPATVSDGDRYIVATGASGNWEGQEDHLAIASNGGWVFLEPRDGWQGWLADEQCRLVYAGGAWHAGVLGVSQSGAASRFLVSEAEVELQQGSAQFLAPAIPKDSMVFGCSARVAEEVTGSLTSWSLGLDSEPQKFGHGMGLQAGSYCTGLLSQPTTLYSSFRPYFTPTDGLVASGTLKVAVHYLALDLPS